MAVDFNADTDHIDVPINRSSLIIPLLIVFCIAILGVCFIISPSTFVVKGGYRYNYPGEIFVMGLICIIICGPCVPLMLYILIRNKPGVSITEIGVEYNIGLVASGLIKWGDITKFTNEDSLYPVYIIINIKDPEQYIQNQTNIIRRYFVSANYKKYGSSTVIYTVPLKCDFSELNTLLVDTLKIYQEDAAK